MSSAPTQSSPPVLLPVTDSNRLEGDQLFSDIDLSPAQRWSVLQYIACAQVVSGGVPPPAPIVINLLSRMAGTTTFDLASRLTMSQVPLRALTGEEEEEVANDGGEGGPRTVHVAALLPTTVRIVSSASGGCENTPPPSTTTTTVLFLAVAGRIIALLLPPAGSVSPPPPATAPTSSEDSSSTSSPSAAAGSAPCGGSVGSGPTSWSACDISVEEPVICFLPVTEENTTTISLNPTMTSTTAEVFEGEMRVQCVTRSGGLLDIIAKLSASVQRPTTSATATTGHGASPLISVAVASVEIVNTSAPRQLLPFQSPPTREREMMLWAADCTYTSATNYAGGGLYLAATDSHLAVFYAETLSCSHSWEVVPSASLRAASFVNFAVASSSSAGPEAPVSQAPSASLAIAVALAGEFHWTVALYSLSGQLLSSTTVSSDDVPDGQMHLRSVAGGVILFFPPHSPNWLAFRAVSTPVILGLGGSQPRQHHNFSLQRYEQLDGNLGHLGYLNVTAVASAPVSDGGAHSFLAAASHQSSSESTHIVSAVRKVAA